MHCLLCGGEVIYEGLLTQECINESCDNFSPALRNTAPDENYEGWMYNEELGIWIKHEFY